MLNQSLIKHIKIYIEVIVVNDGSTDKTSEIADRLKNKDNRVVVIHNPNKGVSASRNDGLQKSSGDYIVFVDADDFLAVDYIDYMLTMANTTDSDFCLSKNCYTKINEKQVDDDTVEVLSPADAIALLLSPRVIVGCWNKIFKKEFLLKKN